MGATTTPHSEVAVTLYIAVSASAPATASALSVQVSVGGSNEVVGVAVAALAPSPRADNASLFDSRADSFASPSRPLRLLTGVAGGNTFELLRRKDVAAAIHRCTSSATRPALSPIAAHSLPDGYGCARCDRSQSRSAPVCAVQRPQQAVAAAGVRKPVDTCWLMAGLCIRVMFAARIRRLQDRRTTVPARTHSR